MYYRKGTIFFTAKLLCIAVALAPAFKMKFWNIGAEGQVLIGALSTAIVMVNFSTLSTPLLFTLMIVSSVVMLSLIHICYTLAHINGIKEAAKELGISDSDIVWKYNISESDEVSKAADQLVAQGCKLIISNSYGHQDYICLLYTSYQIMKVNRKKQQLMKMHLQMQQALF